MKEGVGAIYPTEENNGQVLERLLKLGALYLLSGGAAFSLEVVVYADKGWQLGWNWWGGVFLPVTIWMMAPYTGLSYILLKKKHTQRQLLVLFFGAVGMAIFGIFTIFDAFFIHIDPRNKVLFGVVPLYQWLAVAGTVALRHAVGPPGGGKQRR